MIPMVLSFGKVEAHERIIRLAKLAAEAMGGSCEVN